MKTAPTTLIAIMPRSGKSSCQSLNHSAGSSTAASRPPAIFRPERPDSPGAQEKAAQAMPRITPRIATQPIVMPNRGTTGHGEIAKRSVASVPVTLRSTTTTAANTGR